MERSVWEQKKRNTLHVKTHEIIGCVSRKYLVTFFILFWKKSMATSSTACEETMCLHYTILWKVFSRQFATLSVAFLCRWSAFNGACFDLTIEIISIWRNAAVTNIQSNNTLSSERNLLAAKNQPIRFYQSTVYRMFRLRGRHYQLQFKKNLMIQYIAFWNG